MSLRVLVLFNQPVLPKDHPDYSSEADILYSVQVVRTSLKNVGITSSQFGVTDNIADLITYLNENRPDVVFNLYEGPADNSVTEVYLAGLLEWLGIPFTGCPSLALSLARNKALAKQLFQGAGVPTAPYLLLGPEDAIPKNPLGWPTIVKPAAEDASVGIEQDSVVQNNEQLRTRIQFLRENYGGSVLLEKYITGRELHVSVVDIKGNNELVPLPFGEVAFQKVEDGTLWPIYSYTAKWNEQSEEYRRAAIVVGAKVSADLEKRLHAVADTAFRAIGCRDYARIDTRVTEEGEIFVLEVNPNPSIYSVLIDSGLPAIGTNYDEFIHALVKNAIARGKEIRAGVRRVRDAVPVPDAA